ncbi:flavin reductase family protein [Rhizobium leguminosarum]|uniref:flavin reductase family protein n=1 Tax=Rhizobium leguminosarum TaxID=384 RepID=UPI001F295D25|nr:flavin reductase family protein [Rhizobium leguminosarum]UIJ83197.1 flavin reductase family protein [Rhizobium leguminosarum]
MSGRSKSYPSVASADYVAAIAQHVSSVCVVTTSIDGEYFGLTATAVSSVSAEPPRLLVCINKSGTTHEKILKAGRFCVNVLAEDQEKVAMVFAGMGTKSDRFSTGKWTEMQTGAPVLVGAAAAFDCIIGETIDQSSHTIVIGDVVATNRLAGADTVLYGARRFRQLRKVFAGLGSGVAEYL